jgi:hypothetical protein
MRPSQASDVDVVFRHHVENLPPTACMSGNSVFPKQQQSESSQAERSPETNSEHSKPQRAVREKVDFSEGFPAEDRCHFSRPDTR